MNKSPSSRPPAEPTPPTCQIAAIVHSWRFSHDAWVALTEAERDQMISDWAAIIRRDKAQAVDAILADILARPVLGPAWRRLSEFSPSSARPAVFTAIVAGAEPDVALYNDDVIR